MVSAPPDKSSIGAAAAGAVIGALLILCGCYCLKKMREKPEPAAAKPPMPAPAAAPPPGRGPPPPNRAGMGSPAPSSPMSRGSAQLQQDEERDYYPEGGEEGDRYGSRPGSASPAGSGGYGFVRVQNGGSGSSSRDLGSFRNKYVQNRQGGASPQLGSGAGSGYGGYGGRAAAAGGDPNRRYAPPRAASASPRVAGLRSGSPAMSGSDGPFGRPPPPQRQGQAAPPGRRQYG